MPESSDTDLAALKARLEKAVGPKQIVEKPVGFGLVMLELLLVFDDKVGAGDFEEKVKSVEGVGSVESGDITLI